MVAHACQLLHHSQQPCTSSGEDFHSLWTTAIAQRMPTNNSKCLGNQRFRRDYIIFPHGREGWQQGEHLSGIEEATQECVEGQTQPKHVATLHS